MHQEPDPPPALPSTGSREFVHELNNRLTVVLAQAEVALSSEDPDDMKRALQVIAQAASCMADSVRSFAKSPAVARSFARDSQRIEGP